MLMGKGILIVEDEVFLRKGLAAYLEAQQADVTTAASLSEARNCLAADRFDYLLLDVNLPDGNGLEFLRELDRPQTMAIVVMTAEGGIRTAVQAIQLGAADYLSKPFEPEALPMVFSRIERERSRRRLDEFARESTVQGADALFVGERLQGVHATLRKILKADERLGERLPPVLIEGETGTGKSTFARWLHHNGPRAKAPLVEVNAATLPDQLAESELFGHERGAFTDARKERIGLFEAADGGTLFIDEIASLSPAVQAKLLTAIEEGCIRRLGSNLARRIDVRLIAASLHPLRDLVDKQDFREDLYHRLNLLHLRIPPLREFPADLPALAEQLLRPLRQRYRLPQAAITRTGHQRLLAYTWPGNVRELLHELERGLIFSEDGQLDFPFLQSGPADSPPPAGSPALLNPTWDIPPSDFNLEAALRELTSTIIRRALERCDGNVSAAARLLGVPRDFVRYRLGET